MTKPNKDGWMRHRGGKCPVERDTLIDVRHRDGYVYEARPALGRNNWDWQHFGRSSDIMSYRLHHQETKEPTKMTAEQIRTNYTKNLAAIAALHKDQASLVQQLRELGFAFVAIEPEEDMSDPKNWRVGDELEVVCIDDGISDSDLVQGEIVDIVEHCSMYKERISVITKSGKRQHLKPSCFKFHSRPAKK